MLNNFCQGLLFGLAYVAPIGSQNLYVLDSSLQRNKRKVSQVVAMIIFFDILLALSCYFGIGLLIKNNIFLKAIVLALGCVVVIYIGVGLLRSSKIAIECKKKEESFLNIMISSFTVTWLNPQAIIDGSLLLGGFRTTIEHGMSQYFIIGVCFASMAWFSILAFIVYNFLGKFKKIVRYINIICGVILILYGIKLGYALLKLII